MQRIDILEIVMRPIGFLNTFCTVAVFDMAFRAGVRRHNAQVAAARSDRAAADAWLDDEILANEILKNVRLKRMLAARNAARQYNAALDGMY